MYKFILFLVTCAVEINVATSTPDPWASRARVVNPLPYFSEAMEQFVHQLEKREWCNLKMVDIHKNVNTYIANLNVTGTVTYTNGFVVSVQAVDLHKVSGTVFRRNINGITYPMASVTGLIMFHDVNVGYDVIANLTDIGEQRYTGEILNNEISLYFLIEKNLISQEITVSSRIDKVTGTNILMIYRPANRITEVLSRHIRASDNWDGVESWIPDFVKILTEIVNHKIEFPKICLNDC